jgi:hypothetical protein
LKEKGAYLPKILSAGVASTEAPGWPVLFVAQLSDITGFDNCCRPDMISVNLQSFQSKEYMLIAHPMQKNQP